MVGMNNSVIYIATTQTLNRTDRRWIAPAIFPSFPKLYLELDPKSNSSHHPRLSCSFSSLSSYTHSPLQKNPSNRELLLLWIDHNPSYSDTNHTYGCLLHCDSCIVLVDEHITAIARLICAREYALIHLAPPIQRHENITVSPTKQCAEYFFKVEVGGRS